MKKISLSQGCFAIVDDEDYQHLSQWKWYFARGYAVRSDYSKGTAKQVRMHRQIMQTPESMDTDHKNRNKLDNRKENLRICTRSQNVANTFVKKQNRSGYKGVSWKEKNKKWVVQIRSNNKVFHIGLFKDIYDAARAYNKVAVEKFGEFAVLNSLEIGK